MILFFITVRVTIILSKMLFSYFLMHSVMANFQSCRSIADLNNSYLDSSPLSKSLISANLLNLDFFVKYVVHVLLNVLCHGKLSEL